MTAPAKTKFDYQDEELQRTIHEYRKGRAYLVKQLEQSNWGNADVARQLFELNLRIEIMTRMRHADWWFKREPTLEAIEQRSHAWYYETRDRD